MIRTVSLQDACAAANRCATALTMARQAVEKRAPLPAHRRLYLEEAAKQAGRCWTGVYGKHHAFQMALVVANLETETLPEQLRLAEQSLKWWEAALLRQAECNVKEGSLNGKPDGGEHRPLALLDGNPHGVEEGVRPAD